MAERSFPEAPFAVAAHGLTHTFPAGRRALAGVDLTVSPGEVVGVLGPNGSGKSTLLRVLAGSVRASSGRVDVAAPLADVAFAADHPAFADALDGASNLEALLELRGRKQSEACLDASSWLDTFGLGADGDAVVGAYSLGMRRRLALAEVFAARPVVLLLDEPTLGLDPEGRSTLARALSEAAANGAAAVIATNDIALAATTCDRVIFLHRGAVVAEGAPAALVEALGAHTSITVEVAGDALSLPAAQDIPPAFGYRGGTDSLRFLPAESSAAVADLCRWLTDNGHGIRSLVVEEPDLGDVFMSLTGEAM